MGQLLEILKLNFKEMKELSDGKQLDLTNLLWNMLTEEEKS
jgi:hypothetical protein